MMPSGTTKGGGVELAGRVKAILDRRELNALKLSRLSEILFGRSSPYHLPSNFYYQLRTGVLAPNIYQLFALSKISDYRLADWLHVFGHRLDDLPRLQSLLHDRRTVIWDSTSYNREACEPWFRESGRPLAPDEIIPIARMTPRANSRRISSIERSNGKSFLYAKVGQEDALAYPSLVPGSLVRADPQVIEISQEECATASRQALYLVEHSKGVCCCRLNFLDAEHVELVSDRLPYTNPILQLGREIRILGLIDLEMRPLSNVRRPRVAPEFARPWHPSPIRTYSPGSMLLGELLRAARSRAGLNFKEASAITGKIAAQLGDRRYFIRPASLSSYERLNGPPWHIHKIMSLCVVYCIGFWDFLCGTDISLRPPGRQAIPEDLLPRDVANDSAAQFRGDSAGAQAQAFPLDLFGHTPPFMQSVLSSMSGLPRLSIRDVFWTGGLTQPLHPLLERSHLIVVNRRMKRPLPWPWGETWQQPLYLILLRDGTYVCAHCTSKEDALILHSHPNSSLPPRILRNRVDAEITGRVVVIIRSV